MLSNILTDPSLLSLLRVLQTDNTTLREALIGPGPTRPPKLITPKGIAYITGLPNLLRIRVTFKKMGQWLGPHITSVSTCQLLHYYSNPEML